MYSEHGKKQFKPNTTVAAIVHCQGHFLLVEEWVNGEKQFNQPAGHVENGETLVQAMQRELLEETGIIAKPEAISGVYYFKPEHSPLTFLRICYIFELTHFAQTQPQDAEIIAAHWLDIPQIKQCQAQHRSPLLLQCIEDYLAGKRFPLSLISHVNFNHS